MRKGDIYGFLGPNGAGKTTTIKMILGLVVPDSGKVYLRGQDVSEKGVGSHEGVGYLPERTVFYRNLTARQTMEFFAELKGTGKEECDELLATVGLEKWRDAWVGTFSKGMVQLLGVAQALLGNPELLILDEPTSGLDPRWARTLKDLLLLLERNSRGTTIFFSSHLLFGMFFLGFSILMSTVANKRSTAIAGALFLWFSGMIVGVILFGLWAATGGDVGALFQSALTGGEPLRFPDWLWIGEFFNFMDLYTLGSVSIFGVREFMGFEVATPDFVNAATIFAWFFILTLVSFVSSLLVFKKKDL